jgi:hypothetical protein
VWLPTALSRKPFGNKNAWSELFAHASAAWNNSCGLPLPVNNLFIVGASKFAACEYASISNVAMGERFLWRAISR